MKNNPIETARQMVEREYGCQTEKMSNGVLMRLKNEAMLKAKKEMESSQVVEDFHYWMLVLENITNLKTEDFADEQYK